MTNAEELLLSVQEALLETGEDGQIIRKTQTTDPSNPTNTLTTTKTYNARMYLDSPRDVYVEGGLVVQRSAQLYVDLLSLYDTDTMSFVNSVTSIGVVTEQDDIAVLADGIRLTLSENTGIRVEGVQVMGLHTVSR